MDRSTIIEYLKENFGLYELVSREVYYKYGDDAWALFRTETLECLLIMRKGINKPFTINTWWWDGVYDERGFRENTCDMCKKKTKKGQMYTSGHVLGCGFDFTVKDTSPDLVREWIENNHFLFPCKIRLEDLKDGEPINYIHFDTKYYERHPKIYRFNV